MHGSTRWAVALEGDAFDIEDARDLFAQSDDVIQVRIIEVAPDRNPTVLLAKEFESLTNSSEVFEASSRIFDFLNGIMFLRDVARKPLRPGAVHERQEDGRWSGGTQYAKAVLAGRGRARASTEVLRGPDSSPQLPPPPPPHTIWMTEATQDDTLADVLTFLRGEPDWFDLYKAFELMRDDISRKLGQHKYEQMGWPAKTKLDEFSESAQVHRHSRAKWERFNLSTAMDFDKAQYTDPPSAVGGCLS
jgi:hypothetical protein